MKKVKNLPVHQVLVADLVGIFLSQGLRVGLNLALAIALHNIPEVYVPYFKVFHSC